MPWPFTSSRENAYQVMTQSCGAGYILSPCLALALPLAILVYLDE